MTAQRIVVVGAGIVGAATAYFLTHLGATNVTVFDSNGVAQGCTGVASGGIRRQFATEVETELVNRTDELWREFESKTGVDLDWVRNGYLLLAGESEAPELERRMSFQAELGVDIAVLTRADLAARFPGFVVDDIVMATLTERDGYADPTSVAKALMNAARDAGAQFRCAAVTGIEVEGGRVAAVRTDGGAAPCDVVVDAAGLDAPLVAAFVGVDLPIAPYRQHQFLSDEIGWLPRDLPCTQDAALDLYIRPYGTRVLYGVARDDEAHSRGTDVNWELALTLAEKVERRWPPLGECGIARAWVGAYEVTPDHLPCIGRADDPSGFVYAAGFNGHGFMHGLAVGEAVAELVLTEASSHVDLASFDAARFSS